MLCPPCRAEFSRPGATKIDGLAVSSGLEHRGPARRLVHLLKYQGVRAAALPLAAAMLGELDRHAAALVPVPRAWSRRLRYGVDPARQLARVVGAATGVPVIDALVAPVWWPRHAGSDRGSRLPPRFAVVRRTPDHSVLIDDVLTTGATALAASAVSGVGRVLTATRAENGCFG